MCVVSTMGDLGKAASWPPVPTPLPPMIVPNVFPWVGSDKVAPGRPAILLQGPTHEQFKAFDELLRAAIKFDAATGQKECQSAAKTAWIKTMYEMFGIPCPI